MYLPLGPDQIRCHTAKNVPPWTPNFPDLKLIEHLREHQDALRILLFFFLFTAVSMAPDSRDHLPGPESLPDHLALLALT